MKPMQWVLPLVQGRGAGLGNELIPWARAYLMSRVLNCHCAHPAFGINQRGYRSHFSTGRFDWFAHRVAVRCLPTIRFDESDYLAHGGQDVGVAFASFADEHQLHTRRPLLVVTDGLWGGMSHIRQAKAFVRSTLAASRYAGANLSELGARLDPERLTVAMHVRLGDFAAPATKVTDYKGRFNCSLPLEWFMGIGRQLKRAMGSRVQFTIFSDGDPRQLQPLVAELQPVSTASNLPADASDLLAMASADLLVCSVSSYSIWAATLSDAPYIWFKPQMHEHGQGHLSIWGSEVGQSMPNSPTMQALADRERALKDVEAEQGRAFAVGFDESVPESLMVLLALRENMKRRASNLVEYGVVPQPRSTS